MQILKNSRTGWSNVLIYCFFLIGTAVFGQNQSYQKHQFKWKPPAPSVPVSEQFKDQDAVILSEKTEIGFYNYPVLRIHYRIKYLTREGIYKFSKFTFPRSFDPAYDYHHIMVAEREKRNMPPGKFQEVDYFAARIIQPNGKIKKAIVEDNASKFEGRIGNAYGTAYSYSFHVKNLEPGDELEVFYKGRSIGYTSGRFFFPGKMPKQNHTLSFVYPKEDASKFQYYTVNEPPSNDYYNPDLRNDSIVERKIDKEYIRLSYIRKNLAGCISETGADITTELPYVTDVPPISWKKVLEDAIMPKIREEKRLEYKFDQVFKKLHTDISKGIPDTLPVLKFIRFQQLITDEFLYQDDTDLLTGEDNLLERLPKFVEEKTLRELSRHTLYREAMYRIFEDDYYVGFTSDKRVYQFNPSRYTPMLHPVTLYIYYKKNQLFIAHPKRNKFGYYLNETPFYFENTPVFLVPQQSDSIVNFPVIQIPGSDENINARNTNIMVHVSSEHSTLNFDTKLYLSGQFSTMTRGLYLFNYKDSTINPTYHQKIYDLNNVELYQKETSSTSSDFPFNYAFRFKYTADNYISKKSENRYSISMNKWFNFIYQENFSAENRHLPFHFNFPFTDSFKYYLEFDRPVSIKNSDDLELLINQDFGTFQINIMQVKENILLIESKFTVQREKIEPGNTHKVAEIYSAIQKLNESVLELELR